MNDEEEVKALLKAYAISTSGGIQLPSRVYLDQITGILDIPLSRARTMAENYKKTEFKPSNTPVRVSENLMLGMYNATLDVGKTINIGKLRDNVKEFEIKEINGLTFKAVEMTTRYGKFKKSSVYTKEYGMRKVANVPNKELSSLHFLVKITKGNKVQGASFSIFNTGRVRFSGGYMNGLDTEPKSLVTYMDTVTGLNMSSKEIKVNNITSEIKVGAKINLDQLYSLLDVGTGLAKFDGYTISATFEPLRNLFINKKRKDSPFLYVKFDNKFTILLSSTGSLVVEGQESPSKTMEVTKKFIDFLRIADILTPTGRTIIPSPKPSKLSRRANNQPAPNITRRGSTCPKDKRPKPYSFQGECPGGKNFYVRPNPQGQPCCYRIPKRLEYITNKVAERYKKANVKIPERVKKIFGITQTNIKAPNVGKKAPTNLTYNKNKLGSRQCMRYTKVSLVDIAIRMGLSIPDKATKVILCEMIAKHLKSFKLQGKDCLSYKRSTLVKYATELGIKIKDEMTKEDICKEIQNFENKNFSYFMNLAKQLKTKNDSK